VVLDSVAFGEISFGGSRLLFALAGGAIQLVPDGTILFHLVLILVMVALLNATLLKPINRILEERERRTRGRFSEAEMIVSKVEEKLGEYESRLRQARTEAYALMERERLAAAAARERRLVELRTELSHSVAEQKAELQKASEAARVRLSSEAKEIATVIGQRILGRPIVG
jgi:F-type H+-transporting ATPase subunit b